jgi:hypothetical protein
LIVSFFSFFKKAIYHISLCTTGRIYPPVMVMGLFVH